MFATWRREVAYLERSKRKGPTKEGLPTRQTRRKTGVDQATSPSFEAVLDPAGAASTDQLV